MQKFVMLAEAYVLFARQNKQYFVRIQYVLFKLEFSLVFLVFVQKI